MKKFNFKLLLFNIVLFSVLSCGLNVFAGSGNVNLKGAVDLNLVASVNLNAKGSINIILKDKDEKIANAGISVYKIAECEIANNNLQFVYNDDFNNFECDVRTLINGNFENNLKNYILNKNLIGNEKFTDNNGKISINNMPTGLYFIVQSKSVEGYYDFNPFLISIPYEENGEWIYDVVSTPKVSKKEDNNEKPGETQGEDGENNEDGQGQKPGNNSENDNGQNQNPGSNSGSTSESKPGDNSNQNGNNNANGDANKKPGTNANAGISGNDANNSDKLIQTGQTKWPIAVFGSVGIILIIGGVLVIITKKNDNAYKKIGVVSNAIGVCCILVSLAFYIHNYMEDRNAGIESEKIMNQIISNFSNYDENQNSLQNEKNGNFKNNSSEMVIKNIDGNDYIGYLTIPSLNLNLPIMSDWNYDKLKIAPCRYNGWVDTNDFVIAAHNYKNHFGELSKLKRGDVVTFTDMGGNDYKYEVGDIEILEANQVEEMNNSGWDLSLYTCVYSGSKRLTVRLKK